MSASTAHPIKTCKLKFDELAESMIIEIKAIGLKNCIVFYDIKNENKACEFIKKIIGCDVQECDLVIHSIQPWLFASTDEMVVVLSTLIKIFEIVQS